MECVYLLYFQEYRGWGITSAHSLGTDKLRIPTSVAQYSELGPQGRAEGKFEDWLEEITVIFCFQTLLSFVLLETLPEGKLQETGIFFLEGEGAGEGAG